MSKRVSDEQLSRFDARLARLKNENSRAGDAPPAGKQSGYGMAFGIAADLVGGLVGGAGIGWLVDRWLGSAPLGLIGFFFLGAAAGMWNVYRTVRGYDMSFGFSRQPGASRGEPDLPADRRAEGGEHGGQSTPSIRSPADHPDSHRRR